MPFSQAYVDVYQGLPEVLENSYPHLNFKNHCYLRMALDHLFGTKWDTQIKRPAHHHLNMQQKKKVRGILKAYGAQPQLMYQHHRQSLTYRKQCQKKQLKLSL